MLKQREHKAEDTNAPESWGDQEGVSWASSSAIGHGWRLTSTELREASVGPVRTYKSSFQARKRVSLTKHLPRRNRNRVKKKWKKKLRRSTLYSMQIVHGGRENALPGRSTCTILYCLVPTSSWSVPWLAGLLHGRPQFASA